MISLKPYLRRASYQEMEGAYCRMIDLLLQVISVHAVEDDLVEHKRFQTDIHALADRFEAMTTISDRSVVVGEALHTIEEHNRRTTKSIRTKATELQKMATMLTEAVIAAGAHSEACVTRLEQIEKSLSQVLVAEDVRLLKSQLSECLEMVRDETQRQKAERGLMIEQLQQQLAQSQTDSRVSAVSIDTATELPDILEANKELNRAIARRDSAYVLLIIVNRLQAINARFGYVIGDKVLGVAARHFRSALSAADKLYRWQGPSLLGILRRGGSMESVSSEVRRFADVKLEGTFGVNGRSILLPISANWTILPIVPPLEMLIRKIEIFTAAQVPRDSAS